MRIIWRLVDMSYRPKIVVHESEVNVGCWQFGRFLKSLHWT